MDPEAPTGSLHGEVTQDEGAPIEAMPSESPQRVGRYVLLDELGRGGMGIVFAAFDTELDRAVALKLLHDERASLNARPRLLREAQALARLSHANIVPVFDVGTEHDRIFVVMELVRGSTLRAWLRRGPRPWREVLAAFVAAGRGLAAAHAAGIVHRDFKPENVLVGDDGRVRVVDFGLALGHGDRMHAPPFAIDDSSSLIETRLTASGLLLGTPAYVAPEQVRRRTVDARSDQYSLCVALHEALFGERPRFDLRQPSRRLTPARSDLGAARGTPAWLRRVLARGLERDPSRRFATMDELLTALSPRPRRRWLGVAGTAIGLALGLTWRAAAGHEDEACPAIGAAHWDGEAHERVRAAMLATDLGYAATTWSRVASGLDAYAAALDDAGRVGCLVPEPTDAIARCVHHREVAFAAAIEVLANTDDESLARAQDVVAGLPSVAACSDPVRLGREPPEPTDPDRRRAAASIRELLARVRALADARRFEQGIELADGLVAEAETLGDPAVSAEVEVELGGLLAIAGRSDGAEEHLVRAAMLARGCGHDVVAAQAMTRLVGVVGYQLADVEGGRSWARHAEAMTRRGALERRWQALLDGNLGALEYRAGDYAAALMHYTRIVESLGEPADDGERRELANALNNLGNVHARRGDLELAFTTLTRALAVQTELFGPDHPQVATTTINLANVEYDRGRFSEALALHRRALAVARDGLGEHHPIYATALGNIGLVLYQLGSYDEAQIDLARALELKRRMLPAGHPDIAFTLNNLGELERWRGHAELALELHREAVGIWRDAGGKHPYAVYPQTNVGLDLLALGRVDAALVELERAVDDSANGQVDPTIAAAAQFGRAQAAWVADRDRPAALAAARAARTTYAAAAGRFVHELRMVDAWLAEHG